MKNLKIELHLLQNFPPSCLNRDDTNTPKTCEFGGVTRARVSSQCWKRAIREQFPVGMRGTRSKRLVIELVEALHKAGKGERDELYQPVINFVEHFYAKQDGKEANRKEEEKKHETDVLVFYGPAEKKVLLEILSSADTIDTARKDVTKLKKREIEDKITQVGETIDIALFGRMLAKNPNLNIDAACQVAHAISTHSVNLELDFFTAVDDLKDTNDNDDAGAGMLGTVGYDSACYYRYALVDDVQLTNNLNGSETDADASLDAFLKAFCDAIPSAKKNSFAHGNPPFFAFFVVRREGTPASLVNAFAKPVNARNGNLLNDSVKALANQVGRLDACYELYTDPTNPRAVKTFLSHTLDTAELAGLPTQENLSMRNAIAGVVETVKAFRETQA